MDRTTYAPCQAAMNVAGSTVSRSSNSKKIKIVVVASGPEAMLSTQETFKNVANIDQTNDTIAKYISCTLGLVASSTIRTLMRYGRVIGETTEQKYRFVTLKL